MNFGKLPLLHIADTSVKKYVHYQTNKTNSISISYSTFCNAPWVNFLHQNIFEWLAYFGPIFLLLFLKSLALGILDITIPMKVRFLTNNSVNCQIYKIHSLRILQIVEQIYLEVCTVIL
jgi:hypothetical protein